MIEFFKSIVAYWKAVNKLADVIIEMQSHNRCHDPEFRAQFKR